MLQIRPTDTDTWNRASAINLLDTDPDTDPDNEIWNSSLTQEFYKDIVTKIAA